MGFEKKEFTEEEMENISEQIKPTMDDFMDRRISNISFAKVIIWLCVQCKKQDFVYASELSEFMIYSQTRAYSVLRDLVKAGIMKRVYSGNLVEFHFIKNTPDPIILKYFEKARKTLDKN